MHLVILLFAMFASLFTLQKEALNYTEQFFLVGARMSFAGILLLSFVYLFDRKNFKFKLAHIKDLVLLSLAAIYVTNVCEIWGINNMVSSKACLIYSLSPFLTAIVAYIVLKEKLSGKKIWGMLIGFIGLLPITYTQTSSELRSGTFFIFTMAEIAVLGAVLCSVYGWILLKKIISEYKYSPIMANGIAMTIGGILALTHSYISGENWQPVPVSNYKPFILYSLTMCLISNIICYNLYGYLLKRFSANFMSFFGLVTPIFASFFGWLFLAETITWHFFASIAMFSIGLVLFYQEEIKKGKVFPVNSKLAKAV
jgi:drug/metabolite transporter (DMT)-like permease